MLKFEILRLDSGLHMVRMLSVRRRGSSLRMSWCFSLPEEAKHNKPQLSRSQLDINKTR